MTEPTNAELASQVQRLAEQLAESQKRITDLEAELDDVKSEKAELENRVAELESETDELETKQGGTHDYVNSVNAKVNSVRDDVDELIENGGVAMDEGAGVNYEDCTTVEKYSLMTDEELEESLSASEHRAVETFRNFHEWSDSVPAGRTIDTSDLRKLLTAKFDEALESKQILRTGRALERLSSGKIVLCETKRHGYQLIQPEQHEFASRTTATSGSTPESTGEHGVTSSSA